MKVLLDTNVYVSYILAPERPGVIETVVATCLSADEVVLLVPAEQVAELTHTLTNKPYFRAHVSQAVIDRFVAQLEALINLQPVEDIASYSRDPKDDYLITYGVVNEADYLVTGDKDLLILTQVGTMQIVSPSQLLIILQKKQN